MFLSVNDMITEIREQGNFVFMKRGREHKDLIYK